MRPQRTRTFPGSLHCRESVRYWRGFSLVGEAAGMPLHDAELTPVTTALKLVKMPVHDPPKARMTRRRVLKAGGGSIPAEWGARSFLRETLPKVVSGSSTPASGIRRLDMTYVRPSYGSAHTHHRGS
jgi:ubiquinone/menaquinone biosynthesis C-methylase UbiE